MQPNSPIAARLIFAVLIVGLIGHLSVELQARLRDAAIPTATESDSAHARGSRVRGLALARTLLMSQPLQGEQALVSIVRESDDRQVRESAIDSLVAHAAAEWPSDRRGEFMTQIAAPAIRSGREHRIPPSITIAQAIHESGWGRSTLARKHHNLFGIKASGAQAGATFPTLEYTASGVRVEPARFRIYLNADESMAEHATLLAQSPRYAGARKHVRNWRAYLKSIAPTYATDPKYPRMITQIIERYSLDRWDEVVPAQSTENQPT